MNYGENIYELACKLWPINRSITGEGVRQTLGILKECLSQLQIKEVSSGTTCFDWTVPREWHVKEAWIADSEGKRIIDFHENNLHLVGYSTPINAFLSLEELQLHLHSLPETPSAIPYITSYYNDYWGFCISQENRDRLKPGQYHVFVDSKIFDGSMTYGEIYIPGITKQEILLSTYICHPSMANNELSGPCVTTWLVRWLEELSNRRYSYRILFLPETIGSIYYISRHLEELKDNVIAGFVLTCLGDERAYSYLASRDGNTLADKVAKHVLSFTDSNYKSYSFLERGSDERQYCSPGVDLPVCSIMRSKYANYPEYHTSLDNLDLITPQGLGDSMRLMQLVIECLENNLRPCATKICEPQLGRRGLYPSLSTVDIQNQVQNIINLLAYSDGKNSLLEIADILGVPMWNLVPLAKKLKENGLLYLQPD